MYEMVFYVERMLGFGLRLAVTYLDAIGVLAHTSLLCLADL